MPLRCARSQRESSERHSPLYVSNTAREMSGMTIDESGTSFPPMYESDITVRALTAAGPSRSYRERRASCDLHERVILAY